MGAASGWPLDFLAFVQMYSICDLNVSFSSKIMPNIFYGPLRKSEITFKPFTNVAIC